MHQPLCLLFPHVRWMVLVAFVAAFSPAAAEWWEQPHDKWYFKDDWKAGEVGNYSPTIKLTSSATNGWIIVWGNQGVTLRVNGVVVMKHVDRGLIYDTNFTPIIQGSREVKIEAGPGRMVAEGEITDDQGRRYPFASGCNWPSPAPEGARLPLAARPYRPGEASGAFHSAHNGLLVRYNEEERGKADISKALARLQKLRDQSIFLLRRFSPAEEILSFSSDTLWRRAERFAAGPMAEAEKVLKQQAIPAQKQGNFTDAIVLAAKAGVLLAAAELAIDAARELEEAGRHLAHLQTCAALMASQGTNVPPLEHDFAAVHATLAAARREAGADDWGDVQRRNGTARAALAALEGRLSRMWGSPVGRLDEFPEDRFGWYNAQGLLENNPEDWEFSVLDPAANWIDLSGRWDFRTDPSNQGEQLGWHRTAGISEGWRLIKVPGEWERAGVLDDNDHAPWDCPYTLQDRRCEDKPYNGYAWYRREVLLPNSWRGRNLTLRVGKASNWLRVFANGRPAGEPRRDGGAFALPADALKFGEANVIAIQIYNHDNFGGITGGPVALAAENAQPDTVITPGPLSWTHATTVRTPDGDERTVAFASAMTPAAVLTSDQSAVRLWGWEAKGFAAPATLAFQTHDGAQKLRLTTDEVAIEGPQLEGSWLLLGGGQAQRSVAKPAPVFLVLERRPRLVRWAVNALGFHELDLSFDQAGSRIVLHRLSGTESEWDAATCQRRAGELRAVPIACSELAKLDTRSLRGEFLLGYHYLEIQDFTGEPAERFAPLPLLLSYAMQNRFPGLDVVGDVDSFGAQQEFPFRVARGTSHLLYRSPLIDKSKLLKGVGELFAKRRLEDNARGGNTEQRMFDDWKEWGFDHCRYAFAWGAPWDLPLQKFMGGPISDDPELWARMDYLVKQHTDRGIMAMLCYFFNEDSPQRDSRNLVRNSTRYWRLHPEVRTNCYELWRRLAQRCADYPAHLVAYDFFNEPAYMHRDDWNQIIRDLTRIVRSVDRTHLIVCEAGDGWSQPQWFHWVEPTGDTNTLYSFHHYGKHWGYDRDEYYPGYQSPPEKENDILLEVILFSIRHNVPVHCGEFGVSLISPGEDHLAWLDDYLARFERFGIGWNWWNWSGSDIYRTGLKAGDEVSPNLAILRKWIDRKKSWR